MRSSFFPQSRFLTTRYGFPVPPSEVVMTCGSSSGICMSLETFGTPECRLYLEDPTYFIFPAIIKSVHIGTGPNTTTLPSDEYGLCVEALETRLVSTTPSNQTRDLLYCIPAHHNPTACTLSTHRRARLVLLARKYGLTLICDEPYQLLDWSTEPLPRAMRFFDTLDDAVLADLAARTRDGDEVGAAALVSAIASPNAAHTTTTTTAATTTTTTTAAASTSTTPPPVVVSLGSFSKILAPGLRMGWLHAHPALVDRFERHGLLWSGGGLNPMGCYLCTQMITDGTLDRTLAHLCTVYRARSQALCQALREYFPAGTLHFREPSGGYFVWVRFPEWCQVEAMCGYVPPAGEAPPDQLVGGPCTSQNGWGVAVRSGATCTISGKHFGTWARMCFAFYGEEEIRWGVRRLAALYRRYKEHMHM
ncbi:putative PLP-dependent aminotransferase family protein [Paratrimastix pyriformis]|uniref:PLP-dependent aminotransferase family protein n=1 Tax=Paratrimastix pyriformis TaxID=342808 RepID=A0ABQ8UVJ5_9EUKA|nr:putative PLP-dependent aminotransferase family protein [Paratrimastix pyriformis]